METNTTRQTGAVSKTDMSKSNVDRLFLKDKITPQDLEDLNERERKYFNQTCTDSLGGMDCYERECFVNKIELIMTPDSNNQVWECNHATITAAIADYMAKHAVMPTKNTIVKITGLSRPTVIKHLKEYSSHPEFTAKMEQFKFMAPNMLANVYKTAVGGDMRAAKLYLDMVGAIDKKQPATVVNKQHNYIQINNTILSQENLEHLTHDQLNQIERIITDKKMKVVAE